MYLGATTQMHIIVSHIITVTQERTTTRIVQHISRRLTIGLPYQNLYQYIIALDPQQSSTPRHYRNMPLWLIYHPAGTFEDLATKQGLYRDITAMYTDRGLPAFYVIVNFIKLPSDDIFIGGRPNTENPFIRIIINHIAIIQPNTDEAYYRVRTRISQILKPYIADKCYDEEFHVDETERRLWRIQGMDPPPFESEQEKLWAIANKAVDLD
jgi:hypothetical protein